MGCIAQLRNPAKPATDIELVLNSINGAKELIGTVMEELRKEKDESQTE